MLTELDFYRILWSFVAGWPPVIQSGKEIKWKRPHVFVVVHDKSQIEQWNFGTDHRDSYGYTYFNRFYDQSEYTTSLNYAEFPALAVYEMDFQKANFASPNSRRVQEFELHFLAPMPEAIKADAPFDPFIHYNFATISTQLKHFIDVISVELSELVLVKEVTLNDTSVVSISQDAECLQIIIPEGHEDKLGWKSKSYMKNLQGSGSILSFNHSKSFSSSVVEKSPPGSFFIEAFRDDLVDMYFKIKLQFEACKKEGFDYSVTKNIKRTDLV